MPEIRFDIVSGAFAVIATERTKRPSDWKGAQKAPKEHLDKDPGCPFCPGNEHLTPPEVTALREGTEPDQPGWKVRVVPNKFPALIESAALTEESREVPSVQGQVPEDLDTAMYWRAPGVGAHEVVIETIAHDGTLGSYTAGHMQSVLEVMKERTLLAYDRKEIKYVQVFKNHGERGGASMAHPHFQIIGLSVLPTVLANEGARQRHYESKTGRCLFCDLVEREIEKGVRVVQKSKDFAVIAPFASRYSYETMIVPRKHISSFADAKSEDLSSLAETIVNLFGRYESMFSSLPYNMVFHGMPLSARETRKWPYHAHIHIYPRLNTEAGLELGTGVYINPSPPELATQQFLAAPADEGGFGDA
ncbi:MAG: galactose-1-phosphate uridylyltransferase [Bacillota bacterium]